MYVAIRALSASVGSMMLPLTGYCKNGIHVE
jgi:hypothetical protein